MTTIVGLKSGKEYLVEDDYFVFTDLQTGKRGHVFVSVDRKRLITIPPGDSAMEFFEEPFSEEALQSLSRSVALSEVKKEVEVDHDPNVG